MDALRNLIDNVGKGFEGATWNRRLFRRYVAERAGNGDGDVFWYSGGSLIDLNRGLVLTNLEGLEAVKVVEKPRLCQEDEDCDMTATIATRKIIFHKDVDSGSYIASVNIMGRIKEGIDPIQFPYQLARLTLTKSGRMEIEAANSKLRSPHRAEVQPPTGGGVVGIDLLQSFVSVRRSPLQGPLPQPKASPASKMSPPFFEKYDYILGSDPGRFCWSRHGKCPIWFGGKGNCVMHLRGRRINNFTKLPAELQTVIDEVAISTEYLTRQAHQREPDS